MDWLATQNVFKDELEANIHDEQTDYIRTKPWRDMSDDEMENIYSMTFGILPNTIFETLSKCSTITSIAKIVIF